MKFKKIGARFRRMRTALNLSQQQLADKIGVKQAAISKIELGVQRPSDPTLKVLSYSFGINRGWLLDGDEGPMITSRDSVDNESMVAEGGGEKHDPRMNVLRRIDAAIEAFNRQRNERMQAGSEVMDFRKGYGKEVSQKYTWISHVKAILERGCDEDKKKLKKLILEAADRMVREDFKRIEELKKRQTEDG